MYEYTKSPVKNPLILGALSRPLIISHNAARETINAEKFPALVRKNTDFSSLTPTMINESVKKPHLPSRGQRGKPNKGN